MYLVWTAETPDNSYEFASEVFVIKDGRIRMQAFSAKVKPKSNSAAPGHLAV